LFHHTSSYYSGAQRYRSASLLYVSHLYEHIYIFSPDNAKLSCRLHTEVNYDSPLVYTCFWVPLEAQSQICDSCALLVFYAASNCSFVQRFWDNLSILSSSVKQIVRTLKVGPIVCPETSVRNCHFVLRKIPKERNFIYTPAEASNDKHVRVSECHFGQSLGYVLVDWFRLRHQHIIIRNSQCCLLFYQRYAGATPCQPVHGHAMYPSAPFFSVYLLECIKLNNACISFK
jgi:hypothetical protein